jgi:glycosyltransferase involved in cell wall biosynthesis
MALARTGERGLTVHLTYLAEACLLRRWLRAGDVAHLHAHFGTNPAAVAMLCRILGGPPYSFTVHGPDEFDRACSLGMEAKTRHAAFVVAISHYGRSQLCRWVGPADYPKLQIIHCGLDESFLTANQSVVPDVPRFVFVGRLTTTKGIFVLLEALKMLHDRNESFELAMIGDGPERSELERQLSARSLASAVQFLGWQSASAVREEILRSRALVLPSFAEGLPVVLMESLALGRPVITTWVAGIPELVENGISGWLVPPGSVEALADAMQQTLSTPVLRLTQMGQAGRAKVLQNHNAATEAARLAELFRTSAEAAS